MKSRHDQAYFAFALVTASVLLMSVLNLLPMSAGAGVAGAVNEMLRGVVILVAPVALVVALAYSARLWRDPVLLTLAAGGLVMVAAVAAESFLSRATVNTTGLVYGTAGLLLCVRWFAVRRRNRPTT